MIIIYFSLFILLPLLSNIQLLVVFACLLFLIAGQNCTSCLVSFHCCSVTEIESIHCVFLLFFNRLGNNNIREECLDILKEFLEHSNLTALT